MVLLSKKKEVEVKNINPPIWWVFFNYHQPSICGIEKNQIGGVLRKTVSLFLSFKSSTLNDLGFSLLILSI
jgi:hypothetical protein